MFAANASLRLPFDPVTLSYVLALRGVRPRLPLEAFTYAELDCGNAERLILLAASNPEGTFFGFDSDIDALSKAAEAADKMGVRNLTFSQATISELKKAVDDKLIAAGSFDYVVYNEIDAKTKAPLDDLAALSQQLLRTGGALAYRYQVIAGDGADTALFETLLQGLLEETPNPDESFARDVRLLCIHYFIAHPDKSTAFEEALKQGKGSAWLKANAGTQKKPVKTIETGTSLSGKGMTFLGSAAISGNYLELSTPEGAHLALGARRQNKLYEALKDLAMHSNERMDIWGKEPLQRTENMVNLFGGFTFGTTETPERVARTVTFQGKMISFMGPLYDSILSLATVMPVTIGDLVHHETMKDVDSMTILNSVQLLVACGILHPMRASFDDSIDMENPKLVDNYNQSLRGQRLELVDYAFASSVVGRPIVFPAMQTLVVQALDKGGLQNIAALLSDELMRLSGHPYLRPLGLSEPEKAVAEALRQIENAFNQSMVRWFSLGILHNDNG